MPRKLLLAALLALPLAIAGSVPAQARLFWQTYGSVVPTADGDCTWNANQDYFVPRHPDTCRYGLFSPCKSSCTTSPTCRRCHPFYPGYCSPYGCFHYCWRNHVYRTYCGCGAKQPYYGPYRHGCGPAGNCPGFACEGGYLGYPAVAERPLPNVEPLGFTKLGSIPVDGIDLVGQVAPVGGGAGLMGPLGVNWSNPESLIPNNVLQSLGIPQAETGPQSLTLPDNN